MGSKELKFSREIKEEVREGKGKHAQVHHAIPRWLVKTLIKDKLAPPDYISRLASYVKSQDNAVALSQSEHRFWDELAIEKWQFYGFDKPLGIEMREGVSYNVRHAS